MAELTDYSFGELTVDGERHTRDLIVLPDRVVPDWWRREGHSLAIEDLDQVIDELPGHLILGCGAHGQLHPPQAVLEQLRARGVDVEAMPTAEAVRRYGELNPERTAAALHLTC
ncbi:MAG: MTH938/NDUFAF3 family protein [Solirubrobacterales bacterium]